MYSVSLDPSPQAVHGGGEGGTVRPYTRVATRGGSCPRPRAPQRLGPVAGGSPQVAGKPVSLWAVAAALAPATASRMRPSARPPRFLGIAVDDHGSANFKDDVGRCIIHGELHDTVDVGMHPTGKPTIRVGVLSVKTDVLRWRLRRGRSAAVRRCICMNGGLRTGAHIRIK